MENKITIKEQFDMLVGKSTERKLFESTNNLVASLIETNFNIAVEVENVYLYTLVYYTTLREMLNYLKGKREHKRWMISGPMLIGFDENSNKDTSKMGNIQAIVAHNPSFFKVIAQKIKAKNILPPNANIEQLKQTIINWTSSLYMANNEKSVSLQAIYSNVYKTLISMNIDPILQELIPIIFNIYHYVLLMIIFNSMTVDKTENYSINFEKINMDNIAKNDIINILGIYTIQILDKPDIPIYDRFVLAASSSAKQMLKDDKIALKTVLSNL